MLRLFNTLGRKLEEFTPLNPPTVGMYNCGPTVYDRAHIGNLRTYVFSDTLRRVLERNGYRVNQVMNITDVGHLTSDADSGEDKMTKGLKREGLPLSLSGMHDLATKYTEAFLEDIALLNILRPEELPRASEHIEAQINLIKALEENGYTYATSDGLYFDTTKNKEYGKLGGLSDQTEARVEENTEKKNPRDFALWKFSAKGGSASGGNSELGWESPWGKGFPGWHIECSAMSMQYLGETFDIHTGGIDHIPTHHNNEIAQSECATGKLFAKYWLHGAFLNIDSEKIAKSAGNALTLSTLIERSIDPLAYRYWLLMAHYRSQVNFTWEALEDAARGYKKLCERVIELPNGGDVDLAYKAKFDEALNEDLGTPAALALLWELLKDDSISDKNKKATALDFDQALGLSLGVGKDLVIPEDVAALLHRRELAREAKHWDNADNLRKEIEAKGFFVKDTPQGQKISKM